MLTDALAVSVSIHLVIQNSNIAKKRKEAEDGTGNQSRSVEQRHRFRAPMGPKHHGACTQLQTFISPCFNDFLSLPFAPTGSPSKAHGSCQSSVVSSNQLS